MNTKKLLPNKFKLLVVTCLVFSMTGCWNSIELNAIGIVAGMAFDKPPTPNKVKITVQIIKPGNLKKLNTSKGGQNKAENSYCNISNVGNTVFGTARGLTQESVRKLFYPHNQIAIFSKELAESGLQEYLDFYERQHELRINTYMVISRTKASDILDTTPQIESIAALNVSEMIKIQSTNAWSADIKIMDFMTGLMNKSASSYAPIVYIVNDNGQQFVRVSGTAVFKNTRMTGELDKFETRGLLWALGKIKSTVIEIDAPDGSGKVCLETIKASGKMIPEISNGKIQIKVKIKQESDMSEQSSTSSMVELKNIDDLENASNKIISGEVTAAFEKAKELDTDYFGIGNIIYEKYPEQWAKMEKNWDKIFRTIDLKVEVESRLVLSGSINKPPRPGY